MEWLSELAATRQTQDLPPTTLTLSPSQGYSACTLAFPAPSGSSAAVANLLLNELVAASRPSRQGLSRAVQVEVLGRGVEPSRDPASTSGAGPAVESQQQQHQLVVRFSCAGSGAAAEQQLAQVASVFEAYMQYHIKAAKSNVHTRMRQRLSKLRQQLALTRQPAPEAPVVL
ncbi:hypothetical protein N2152v2_007839 [Parachlorella kessleri]